MSAAMMPPLHASACTTGLAVALHLAPSAPSSIIALLARHSCFLASCAGTVDPSTSFGCSLSCQNGASAAGGNRGNLPPAGIFAPPYSINSADSQLPIDTKVLPNLSCYELCAPCTLLHATISNTAAIWAGPSVNAHYHLNRRVLHTIPHAASSHHPIA